ncbi:hypothetical protein HBE96_13025 [Clostridium sp. P21]|uniref:Uncharacterized protein n=1 Tax=Clostridium muellerianum TaxID=2716538 RepID=A0A7Y0EHJ5_9CLOT|nr:hypothetical protein [Clostridium muellerianum]NMM63581.1 hypothetical protein [Clostridium muellerianum]
MLCKEDIIKILKEIDLPLSEYWITSGAGLVIHGVKEATRDIDLGCTTNLIEQYLRKGCQYRVSYDNLKIVEVSDKIELLENWFVDEIEFIDGLPVGSLESIKKQKMELGRDKDIYDIKLIDEYIKNKK